MSWRDTILNEFAAEVTPITWVADPDQLLTELSIQQAIETKGLELVTFEDAISFRFLLESKYRSQWESTGQFNLVAVLAGEKADFARVPYDLISSSRRLSLSLPELFPKLSYPVLKTLNPADFDALDQAGANQQPKPLGANATKDFLLRHVFKIDPELIQEPTDLLEALLRRHYQNLSVPSILDQRLIETIKKQPKLAQWPLEQILPDRSAFFRFLQDRWLPFVQKQLVKNGVSSDLSAVYGVTEPVLLPLNDEKVRVYVDNLFLEGFLHPISLNTLQGQPKNVPDNIWLRAGLKLDPDTDQMGRLQRLLNMLQEEVPNHQSRYESWVTFAQTWAELLVLWNQTPGNNKSLLEQDFRDLQTQVDDRFLTWVLEKYKGLYSQFTNKPVMLHHVPLGLSRGPMSTQDGKAALLVLDGVAFDQWLILRRVLKQQIPDLHIQESGVFAWLPTITSVSRQALFSGKLPETFPASINGTDKETSSWSTFWIDQGLMPHNIGYLKALDSKTKSPQSSLVAVEKLLANPKLRVAGLVINRVDEIMHGMVQGTAGMHNQVQQWAEDGFMSHLLKMLFEKGFQVFLTADHGNIEARGIGNPGEGAIADQRGERVRVYSNDELRDKVKPQYADTVKWPSIGLPNNYKALFAPSRRAFVNPEETIICHGGISLEEVIVPYIHLGSSNP